MPMGTVPFFMVLIDHTARTDGPGVAVVRAWPLPASMLPQPRPTR